MDWGPYRDLQEIGFGRVTAVYKAWDSREQRAVAIKIMEGLDPTFTGASRELLGEFARLKHPNIVTVFDAGQQEDLLFTVMEYLEVQPLNRAMREKTLTVKRRLELIKQTCMALQHAHDENILHRDIKPGSVFVLQDGSVKVEFGALWRFYNLEAPLVRQSCYYMPPEIFTLSRRSERQSDIWSVGVTLFEVLRGRLPFTAETLEALCDQILAAKFPATPAALPFAQELDLILSRALAKQPEDRYSSAGEMAADLEKLVQSTAQCQEDFLTGLSLEALESEKNDLDWEPRWWFSGRRRSPISTRPWTLLNWGPYRELEEIGRGGMGVVYKARDSRDGRTVAIKIIQDTAAKEPQARLALIREAGMAARLTHSNIVTVFDVGQQEGFLFLVMEYLEGEALSSMIKRGKRLTLSRRLEIIKETCMAIQHAHEQGIIHRDIKPGNIFVLKDGSVKVIDFGLSAFYRPHESSSAVGTPSYMSPEQVAGAEVGVKSDIWSVGVTLFEILRGRLPFTGGTWAVLRYQILTAEFPSTPEALPFARELDRVFCHALAKAPAQRYASAKALAADVEKLIPSVKACEGEVVEDSNPSHFKLNEVTLETLAVSHSRGVNKTQSQSVETQSKEVSRSVSENRRLQGGYPSRYTVPMLGFRGNPAKEIRLSKTLNVENLQAGLIILTMALSAAAAYALARPYIGYVSSYWRYSVFLLLAIYLGLRKATEPWAKNPLCPGCQLPMRVCSEWLNYPVSPLVSEFVECECVSALKSGAWEEGTKLFTTLGKIYQESPEAKWRYQLTFHECVACNEHAARLARYKQSFHIPLWRWLEVSWTLIDGRAESWDQDSETVIIHAGTGKFRSTKFVRSLVRRILRLDS